MLAALVEARAMRRADLLDGMTAMQDGRRRFPEDGTTRRLGRDERAEVVAAFRAYLDTIPESKRFDRDLFYELRDVVGKSGFGIGSAGLPAYNVLVEGYSQALDNDVVLSMKQANIPALSRFVDTSEVDAYFEHEGHRTVGQPARAAGAHRPAARPHARRRRRLRRLGGLALRGGPRLGARSTSPTTCARSSTCSAGRPRRSTAPPTRTASRTSSTSRSRRPSRSRCEGRRNEFVTWLCDWGIEYAVRVREDHALFVDAFREGRVGIAAT